MNITTQGDSHSLSSKASNSSFTQNYICTYSMLDCSTQGFLINILGSTSISPKCPNTFSSLTCEGCVCCWEVVFSGQAVTSPLCWETHWEMSREVTTTLNDTSKFTASCDINTGSNYSFGRCLLTQNSVKSLIAVSLAHCLFSIDNLFHGILGWNQSCFHKIHFK